MTFFKNANSASSDIKRFKFGNFRYKRQRNHDNVYICVYIFKRLVSEIGNDSGRLIHGKNIHMVTINSMAIFLALRSLNFQTIFLARTRNVL